MNFLEELEELLKSDPRFVSQDGQLLKPNVHDAVHNLDAELLDKLLTSPNMKDHFFKKINGVMVFDQEKFMWVVNSKEFLPDSYTGYRNRIGLSAGGNALLGSSNDVSLVWPYKDCVLEGGQDKDDEKRDEIFYNETLAPDEIGRLLAPKAFRDVVRYDASGSSQVTELADDDNLIVKGNNLLALSSLVERYEGKIKCIYIDPPYFFQNRRGEDTFTYNSDFHLSTWLTFMKTRLEFAKRLLHRDGTLWISIGEDGMHYLKVMADSVFGSENFIGTIPRRTRSGKTDVSFNLSQDFDWVLLYTNADKGSAPIGREIQRKYFESDDYPGRPWRTADLTKQTTATERPNSNFTLVDPKNGKEYPSRPKRTWAITRETFQKHYDEGYVIFPGDYDFLNITMPVARKFKDQDDSKEKLGAVISDFLISDFLKSLLSGSKNAKGNQQIDELFSRDEFSYAKPEELLEAILTVSTQPGDLVLDFFLGSGTTAAVAHKMGRRYIGVEQMDYTSTVTVPRLVKVIEGEQGGISKSQSWQGGGSFVYAELAEQGEALMGALEDAQSFQDVEAVLSDATNRGLLRPSVLPDSLSQSRDDFKELSIKEQKQVVAELIDKNRLYINASDVEDSELGLAQADVRFTKSFYEVD
ncbi:DNA methyltransferase [Corynebacterium ammoniagenes]|uniref:DNA (Cytosine-5-)-methyltransferase n=1 Tax=Corynebacterium ammoniagenes DSM 20306 TaxID=649754 RepID=A0ABN0ADW0_CORAM|nr:site-specific DNA-methyltransferase [Corynebacterium ammoniagenes]APT81874.1 DNA methylase [Corynebacterium ammoniagenes DSM 20306]AQS72989.1 DNA methylase [Corynebacterium ammoniagenes]EFG80964.1 DNA (cytosine-5-)-methyltransferase [Corynebacterium ammoniagenes DSM 20306]